jgi:uncharacterized membrane protein YqjE
MNTIKTVFKPSLSLIVIGFCIFALMALVATIIWKRYCAMNSEVAAS